ncbi:hypothetical protein BLX24_21895 [Arsenicibacter rosenii]|uniref:PKD domain-containing protein n=1 Tax=Arsenicibacter rosenii TaxID=1750698 RepID=A0A1S2VFR9_9BACT|nr:hypothetical protein BLX24_21895 [Arsenicibacter rosenii]
MIGYTALLVLTLSVVSCATWEELPAQKQLRQCNPLSASLDVKADRLVTTISLRQPSGTIDEILWEFGDGDTKRNTETIIQHTYKNAGKYVVKATLSNGCKQSLPLSLSIEVSDAVVPAVTTLDPAAIAVSSATLRMMLTDNGNATVTRYGICYSSTNSLPTVDDQVIQLTGTPSLNEIKSFVVSQLTANTVYYLRAFAENKAGKGYGNVKSITTGSQAVVSVSGTPTVDDKTARLFLRVDNPGSPAATQFGIVYSSANTSPEVTNSPFVEVTNPIVGSNVPVVLNNLTPNTPYTYRTYARTAQGVVYGTPPRSFTTQAEAVSNTGLVLYLPFTNRSTADASGTGNNAQMVGKPTFITDRKGNPDGAILLNGLTDYLTIADHASLRPEAISVSMWVRPTVVGTAMQLFNKSRFADSNSEQYAAQLKPSENGGSQQKVVVAFKQNGGCQVSRGWQEVVLYGLIQANQWYHLTFTLGGNVAKLYIGGQLFATNNTLPGNGYDNCLGGELRFGAQIKDYEYFFNGAMDDIRIYQRVLTDTEIKTLTNQ